MGVNVLDEPDTEAIEWAWCSNCADVVDAIREDGNLTLTCPTCGTPVVVVIDLDAEELTDDDAS